MCDAIALIAVASATVPVLRQLVPTRFNAFKAFVLRYRGIPEHHP
jgi:hypothetical protein